jgi:transcriptional regulator with XRE-family HTH domain
MALRGERLKKLRQEKNMTQEEAAAQAKISLRLLQKYEAGDTDPSTEIAARLALLLDTTLDYLVGIEDDPNPRLLDVDLSESERELILAIRQRKTNNAIQAFAALTRDAQ